MAESGIGLLVTETLAGWGSLDISGSHRTVEWSDLPIGGIMLACLYILDMSVIIKSNTLLSLVGARTTCFTPLLLKGLNSL